MSSRHETSNPDQTEAIAAELAQAYNASNDRILIDITAMLQDLADKGVVTA